MEQNSSKIKTARIYLCFVTINMYDREQTEQKNNRSANKSHVNFTALPVNMTIEKVNIRLRRMPTLLKMYDIVNKTLRQRSLALFLG